MTLGVDKRARRARRADKWWRSIYLIGMMMRERDEAQSRKIRE